jgi:hypothetical protein
MRAPHLAVLLACPLLWACPAEPEPEGPSEYTWAEQEEEDNGFARDAEEVDTGWNPNRIERMTITGTMTECDYDQQEDWPWQGDEDNFLVQIPDDGFLELKLDWDDADSDLDLTIYNGMPSGQSISPDEQIANDTKPHEWLWDDPVSSGDEFVFGVLCAFGDPTDYTLELLLEPTD